MFGVQERGPHGQHDRLDRVFPLLVGIVYSGSISNVCHTRVTS
jgi:hypothetical protein